MRRDRQPGDVAVIPFADGDERGMWLGDRWAVTGDRSQVAGYSVDRLLVVIDPEDREQVERLRDLYLARDVERYGLTIGDDARVAFVDDITAALREFANPTPPKPEEPTGLGAVVETPGGRYVRSDVETSNPWRGPKGIPFEWDDLDGPVRVLSEGVTA